MPWHIEKRDGSYCVIKDSDGSSAGCHDSRAKAIKQQRALYANESRMASMYEELDQEPDSEAGMVSEENSEPASPLPHETPASSELVRIEMGDPAITAALSRTLDAVTQQLEESRRREEALVAAMQSMQPQVTVHTPELQPVFNVPAPEITVEAPSVTVEPPPIPNVEVFVERGQQEVKFSRDASGRITGATLEDTSDPLP